MSTITREFTKEQLQQIEAAAKEVLWPVMWSEKKARKHFSEKITPEVVLELARIALASLEAEKERKHHSVIAEQLAHVLSGLDATDHQRAVISCAIDRLNNVAEILQRSPSALPAPPAPGVPDECPVEIRELMASHSDALFHDGDAQEIWNACRAAVLQDADGNSPVIPDGWVACSERMPDIGTEIFYFCQDDDLRNCGIVSSANFSGRGDAQLYVHADGYELRFGVDITHWMPLPAVPQHG